MKVSIRKISEITGFSPATVSNALNYKRGVNAETAAKVLKTAQDLGYFDENKVRKVKFVTFKRSGNIVEDTPFFPMVITGVEEECRACGLELQMVNLDRKDPAYNDHLAVIQNDHSSGVILLGTEIMDEDLDVIRNMDVPFVVIDYWKSDTYFNAVMTNNADSVQMAIMYLVAKGHEKIGYLGSKIRIKPFRSRFNGFKNGIRRAGLRVNENYIIRVGADMDSACDDMRAYLKQKPELPTAFFADDDMIAMGVMKALQEYGYRIPEDISIVGFDDITFSSIVNPPLTTIRVPKKEIGHTAVRRLRDITERGDTTKLKIEVCTTFIERDSVRDLRRG